MELLRLYLGRQEFAGTVPTGDRREVMLGLELTR